LQFSETHAQDRRLDLIEARIRAGNIADIPSPAPAILSQCPDTLGEIIVAGEHHPTITQRWQIFGRVEAECGKAADASNHPGVPTCAMSLRGVLDQRHSRLRRKRLDRA